MLFARSTLGRMVAADVPPQGVDPYETPPIIVWGNPAPSDSGYNDPPPPPPPIPTPVPDPTAGVQVTPQPTDPAIVCANLGLRWDGRQCAIPAEGVPILPPLPIGVTAPPGPGIPVLVPPMPPLGPGMQVETPPILVVTRAQRPIPVWAKIAVAVGAVGAAGGLAYLFAHR